MWQKILQAVAMLAGLLPVAVLASGIDETVKLGSEQSGLIHLGWAWVPLPEGQWVTTAINEYKNNQNNVVVEVSLARFSGSDFSGFITIDFNQDLGGSGWVQNKFCARSDVYYIVKVADTTVDQTCWGINHWLFDKTSTYNPSSGLSIQSYLTRRGLQVPSTMIGALFRFANRSNFITYAYYVNPLFYGFQDDTNKWSNNSWHKDLVSADQGKVEFLERFKAEAARLYEQMSDGGLYREPAGTIAAPPSALPVGGGSIEQRLSSLKDLFDHNLITEAEYQAKRKQILDGL